MKAQVLEESGDVHSQPLQLRDLPLPEPGEGELRVQVRCCGVCRTDLHVVEEDLPPARRPIVPGHQIVGVVDRLGRNCQRWKEGQRVGVAWLRRTCGKCQFCTSGRENLCPNSRYTGYHADGGFAEYAVVPEDFAYEIPDAFDDVSAAPLLCAGLIGYRALARSGAARGGRLGLYGFGSSAHIVLQLARHRGCDVYVVTRGQAHRRLAEQLGATWVGNRADELPHALDGAILFAPVGSLVPPAMEHLERGGTLAVAGIHLTDIPSIEYERHLFYERTLCSVTANTREDARNLLTEAAEIPIRPRIVTYPLSEANQALIDLKDDRVKGTAVLLVE